MRACCVAIAVIVTGSAALAEEPALKVPGAYLDAMETGDLDAAGRLFASESSVFESGGQEGSWPTIESTILVPKSGRSRASRLSAVTQEEISMSRSRQPHSPMACTAQSPTPCGRSLPPLSVP